MNYSLMADIFYADSDKLPKAKAAGIAMDNRLNGGYRDSGVSDIRFDAANYEAYFSYEKLSALPNYIEKHHIYEKNPAR